MGGTIIVSWPVNAASNANMPLWSADAIIFCIVGVSVYIIQEYNVFFQDLIEGNVLK